MPDEAAPRGDVPALALVASAWKSRVFFYISDKHTLKQICTPGYFVGTEMAHKVLPGNFAFINGNDGKSGLRVFAHNKEYDKYYLKEAD